MLGIEIVAFQFGPCEKVVPAEIDPDFLDPYLGGQRRGKRIAESQVFQTAVGEILQIPVVGLGERPRALCGIAAGLGVIGVGSVFRPHVRQERGRDERGVRPGIGTPEEHVVGSRVDVLAADALEEHRKVEPVPGETRIDDGKNCGEYGRTSRRGFAGAACYR